VRSVISLHKRRTSNPISVLEMRSAIFLLIRKILNPTLESGMRSVLSPPNFFHVLSISQRQRTDGYCGEVRMSLHLEIKHVLKIVLRMNVEWDQMGRKTFVVFE
jgi:hypothetical protein